MCVGLRIEKRAVGLASLSPMFLFEDRLGLFCTLEKVGAWSFGRVGRGFCLRGVIQPLLNVHIGPQTAQSVIEPGSRAGGHERVVPYCVQCAFHLTSATKLTEMLVVVQHCAGYVGRRGWSGGCWKLSPCNVEKQVGYRKLMYMRYSCRVMDVVGVGQLRRSERKERSVPAASLAVIFAGRKAQSADATTSIFRGS